MNQPEYDNYLAQSNLQQQAGEQQRQLYAPQLRENMQQAQAVIIEQTNPKKHIKDIILYLQGLEEIDGKVIRWGKPMMNETGIEHMKYILISMVNQGTILSHLEDFQIGKIMENFGNDLVDDLTINCQNYGIINKTDLDIINDTILITIYLALNRSLGQNEKNWLGRITVESLNSGVKGISPPRDGGWLSKFKL